MDDLARRLHASGTAGGPWLPVNGRTFAPLLRPGDEIQVAECDAADLRLGDLALFHRAAVWTVGVVIARAPLRAEAIRGAVPVSGTVHARVVAVRRGGRVRAYGGAMRALAFALRQAARAAGPAVRFVRSSRATRGVRRSARAITLRRLTLADAPLVDAYAAENLSRARELISHQIRGRWNTAGVALGAFDAGGRMRGFIFMDEYAAEGAPLPGHWLRNLSVTPWARRFGTGRALVARACAEAHAAGVATLHADVREDNVASIRLLRGLGFEDADPALAREANRVLVTPGDAKLVVLTRVL